MKGLLLGLFGFGRSDNSQLALYDESARFLVRKMKLVLELLEESFGFCFLHAGAPSCGSLLAQRAFLDQMRQRRMIFAIAAFVELFSASIQKDEDFHMADGILTNLRSNQEPSSLPAISALTDKSMRDNFAILRSSCRIFLLSANPFSVQLFTIATSYCSRRDIARTPILRLLPTTA